MLPPLLVALRDVRQCGQHREADGSPSYYTAPYTIFILHTLTCTSETSAPIFSKRHFKPCLCIWVLVLVVLSLLFVKKRLTTQMQLETKQKDYSSAELLHKKEETGQQAMQKGLLVNLD